MKYAFCFFSVLTLSLFFILHAQASMSPLGISILPPLEFPKEAFAIVGGRFSILWGSHMKVYGVDVGGLGNITHQQMTGVQVGTLMNWNQGESTALGLQLAGLINSNVNKANLIGAQIAGLLNHNSSESSALGVMIAAVNLADFTKITGFEIGLYNTAREINGFQIGIINHTDTLHGLQIGLLNFNHQGLFAVAPILNAGF